MVDLDKALAAEIGSYGRNEWTGKIGGSDVTLYSKPITPADINFVRRHHKDFMSDPSPAGMAELIIRKAEDADGTMAFRRGVHLVLFERMSVTLVSEMFGGLFQGQFDEETDEETEARVKN